MEINVIHNEDCLTGLGRYPDGFFHCCVTSPPYWRQRDYQDERQVGQESDPEGFIARLSQIFREVHRVMRTDGTLWINMGDSYSDANVAVQNERSAECGFPGLKRKELIGIPWMLAFELRKIGFYLRQDIIWHKANPMPESVKDRCTKAHEYIFLLSKSPVYFYNHNAVATPMEIGSIKRKMRAVSSTHKYGQGIPGQPLQGINAARGRASREQVAHLSTKKVNLRSVWKFASRGYKGAHFAAFPERIPDTCIRAGCPAGGVVLDPFMGVGTTAIAAGKLSRSFVGFELNAEYVQQSKLRIHRELGLFC